MGFVTDIVNSAKSNAAGIGYFLGAPGMGITMPMGTQYNVNQTPVSVYNQTKGYTKPYQYDAKTTLSGNGTKGWYEYGYTPSKGASSSVTPGSTGGTTNFVAPDRVTGPTGGGTPGGGGGTSELDIINQAFDAENSFLNDTENYARSHADNQKKTWGEDYNASQRDLEANRSEREMDLQNTRNARDVGYQQETAKVKQLLSDLQNRQAAQMAYRGGYGSNLNPAMGEAFGRQANSSMSALYGQRQQTLDQINSESLRVKNFFDKSMGDLKMKYQQGMRDIEDELAGKLQQVGQMRMESAKAKASATMQAWQNYANQRNQLNLQAYQWEQNYKNWALEKGKSIEEAKQFALNAISDFDPNQYVFAPNQPMAGYADAAQPNYAPVRVNRVSSTKPEDEVNQYVRNLQTFQA